MARVFSLSLVLTAAFVVSAPAQSSWQTVSSKEGNFTVEMPANPTINRTRTRKGPGGTLKVLILGCKANNATYLAHKVDLPTAILKGTEEAELDAERDELAAEWNGKVISQKKVRADGRDANNTLERIAALAQNESRSCLASRSEGTETVVARWQKGRQASQRPEPDRLASAEDSATLARQFGRTLPATPNCPPICE
jgi:hypothetical protein